MAAAQNRRGLVACSNAACATPAMVVENEAGTLKHACHVCGWSCFAKKGEQAHRDLLGKLPKVEPAAAAPAAPPARKAAAEPPPPPPAARPAAGFTWGAL